MVFLTAQGGILGPFCWLLGKILNFIYQGLSAGGIENLALCIIIFTLVVKLILLPLTLRQQKGSKINQLIQPEIRYQYDKRMSDIVYTASYYLCVVSCNIQHSCLCT